METWAFPDAKDFTAFCTLHTSTFDAPLVFGDKRHRLSGQHSMVMTREIGEITSSVPHVRCQDLRYSPDSWWCRLGAGMVADVLFINSVRFDERRMKWACQCCCVTASNHDEPILLR